MGKKATYSLIGLALVVIGVVMFFKSVRIYSWGFYRLGGTVSTGGIVIALILLDVVIYIATQNKIAKILFDSARLGVFSSSSAPLQMSMTQILSFSVLSRYT